MRDLDRFNKRRPISRMEQTPDSGIQISWLGTFCRLFVVLLFIGLLAAGYFTKVMDPILMIVGAFDLKIAAYLTGLIFQKQFTKPVKKD